MQKVINVILAALLICACRSPEQVAARKAAKDAAARQKEIVVLQKVREMLPCVPVQPLKQGITNYLPGEKIPCNGQDSARCADQKFRVDTLLVEDQAALKLMRDSLDQMGYMWDQMRMQYAAEAQRGDKIQSDLEVVKKQNQIEKDEKNSWKKKALLTWVGMGLILAGGVFSKIKGII